MLITRYSCKILIKFENSRHRFEKYWNKKVHENPPRESRVVSQSKDGRMEMTKLIVAFRNYANALKNTKILWVTKAKWQRRLWTKIV